MKCWLLRHDMQKGTLCLREVMCCCSAKPEDQRITLVACRICRRQILWEKIPPASSAEHQKGYQYNRKVYHSTTACHFTCFSINFTACLRKVCSPSLKRTG